MIQHQFVFVRHTGRQQAYFGSTTSISTIDTWYSLIIIEPSGAWYQVPQVYHMTVTLFPSTVVYCRKRECSSESAAQISTPEHAAFVFDITMSIGYKCSARHTTSDTAVHTPSRPLTSQSTSPLDACIREGPVRRDDTCCCC